MARIAGVNLPREKRVEIGLTYIFGIGRSTSNAVLSELGISSDTKVRDLTDEEVTRLRTHIDSLTVEGDLRRERWRTSPSSGVERHDVGEAHELEHLHLRPELARRSRPVGLVRDAVVAEDPQAGPRIPRQQPAGARVDVPRRPVRGARLARRSPLPPAVLDDAPQQPAERRSRGVRRVRGRRRRARSAPAATCGRPAAA